MAWRKGNRLRGVAERDASGRTREIYQDIKHVLGIPRVGPIFEAYAVYPVFLEMHWTCFRPIVDSQEFFALGDRLRADAYTRVYGYFAVPDLRTSMHAAGISSTDQEEICGVIELFNYANPMLLLIAAAQLQAFEGPVGQPQSPTARVERPTFTPEPKLAGEASPDARKLYRDITRTLGMPFVGSAFLALGRWPRFLALYWEALKRVRQSPIYQECTGNLRETAWSLTRELPGVFELTQDQLIHAGMRAEDTSSVVRMTELFVNALGELTLTISVAKIGLEGGSRPAGEKSSAPDKPRAVA